jgi:amino acid transporter
MLSAFFVMLFLSLCFIIAVSSQSPGVTPVLFNLEYPFALGYGFSRLLNVSLREVSLYCILPLLTSSLSTMYVAMRQITAIADSGLFPSIYKSTGKLYFSGSVQAMISTAVLGCCSNFIAWNFDLTMTLRLILLCGFVVYIAMFICFISFQLKYGHMERQFISPFGKAGAVIGILIFSFALVSILFGQENNYAAFMYVSCMAIMMLYFIIFGEANQIYSILEQQNFFKFYIVNGKCIYIHQEFSLNIF